MLSIPGIANFADIIKVSTKSIKTTSKNSKKLEMCCVICIFLKSSLGKV